MSLKEDRVNLVVTINGDQARRELGLLDQKSFDLRDKMKGLKKDSAEYVAASKDLNRSVAHGRTEGKHRHCRAYYAGIKSGIEETYGR